MRPPRILLAVSAISLALLACGDAGNDSSAGFASAPTEAGDSTGAATGGGPVTTPTTTDPMVTASASASASESASASASASESATDATDTSATDSGEGSSTGELSGDGSSGWNWPKPLADSRCAGMPCTTRYFTMDTARAEDSSQLDGKRSV